MNVAIWMGKVMAKKAAPDPYFPDDEPAAEEVNCTKEVTEEVKEPKPEEAKPEETKGRKKHSTIDGPRYTVGLRSETDPCCYKDIFETEKLAEAKEKAQEAVLKYGRGVSVWDRTACPALVERYEPAKGEEEPMVAGTVEEAKKKKKAAGPIKRK